MSLHAASVNSQNLVDSLRITFQQIAKLSKGNDVDLAIDIRDSLKQHQEALELLQQDVDDLTPRQTRSAYDRRDSERSREVSRLAAQVVRSGEELKNAQSQYRRAQLTAKRALEASQRSNREAAFEQLKNSYLANPSDTSSNQATQPPVVVTRQQPRDKKLSESDLLLDTSSDITLALRQTHDRLTAELSRSQFATQTLAESTAALEGLSDRYSGLDSLLGQSKALVGTLVRSQKSDTWYLETAFYLLIVTIVWLIFRRWIYGPAWWFVWLPLKIFLLKPVIFVFGLLGLGRGGVKSAIGQSTSTGLVIHNSALVTASIIPTTSRTVSVVVGSEIPAKLAMSDQPQNQKADGDSLTNKIGQMVEDANQKVHETQDSSSIGHDQIRRGDGTILEARGTKAANPKKRMFEADVEDAKNEQREAGHETVKRDEL